MTYNIFAQSDAALNILAAPPSVLEEIVAALRRGSARPGAGRKKVESSKKAPRFQAPRLGERSHYYYYNSIIIIRAYFFLLISALFITSFAGKTLPTYASF